jgi:hypothetical protein
MATAQSPLHFRGGPTRLTAMLPSRAAVRAGRLILADREPVALTIRPVQSTALSVLSFRLPKSMRPGSYSGSAEVGDAQIPVVVDVEARPRLRFFPPKLSFRGAPGARFQSKVTVLNLGNVDLSIQPESTFCIFDNRGVDRALYEALTGKEENGKRRIDRVMDELAESHGGLVRAVVQEGAGPLPTETARELAVEFQFSRRMRAGQTYRGGWLISETSLEVEIEATGAVDEVRDGQ